MEIMEQNQPLHQACPHHSDRWLNKLFGAARVEQMHRKLADFNEPLPSTTFLNASKGAVKNDWGQNFAAVTNHLEEFERRSVSCQIISQPPKHEEPFLSAADIWQDSCGTINADLTSITVNFLAQNVDQVPMIQLMSDGS